MILLNHVDIGVWAYILDKFRELVMTMTKNAVGNLIARYKTVLQNCSLMNTFGTLAVASMLVLGGAIGAQAATTISADTEAKGATGSYIGDADVAYKIFGGWNYSSVSETSFDHSATNTNITATSGIFDEIHGGTQYKSLTSTGITGSIGNTSVTVDSGVTGVQYVIGGSKANGAAGTFTTGTTAVVINDDTSTALTVTGMAIGGSYAKTNVDSQSIKMITGATSLTINGGTYDVSVATPSIDACVVGGSVAEIYNGTGASVTTTDASTSLKITAGTFEGIVVGGGYAFDRTSNGTATATVTGTATTVITGGTFNKAKIGTTTSTAPSFVAGGYAYGTGATAYVGSTSLTITGGEFAGKVFGGGYAYGDGAKSTVGSTYVYITGGTFEDNIVAGGFVQDTTDTYAYADVTGDTYLEIAGDIDMSSLGGDIVGGGEASRGQANVGGNTTVIIGSGVTGVQGNVYGGGMVNGNSTEGSTANVGGSTTVDISGEILESVFGGGRARSASTGGATANVGEDTNVTINSGASTNGVAGGGWAHGNTTTATNVATANVGGSTYVTIDGTVDSFFDAYTTKTNVGIYLPSTSTLSVAVVGGGVASGRADNNAIANVTGDTNVVINEGAVVNGDVVGGGMVYTCGSDATTYTSHGTATVGGNTNVTINGGTIDGDVYAGGYDATSTSQDVTVTGDATVNIYGGTVSGTLYGCADTVSGGIDNVTGTSTLNLGSDDIAYTGTFTGIQGFDAVNISAGSAITVMTASFADKSILSMNTSSSLVASSSITVASGAILDLSGAAGTFEIENVGLTDTAWGWDGDSDLSTYDADTLTSSGYLTFTSVNYDASTYTVVSTADSNAIAGAIEDSSSKSVVSFAVEAINSGNDELAALIEDILDGEKSGAVIESMAQGASTKGVMSGLGVVAKATVTNTGTRTGMAPASKASAQSETSTWLAMNGDGAILPVADGGNMAQGFGIWFMPMLSHTSADGFSTGSGSYGYDTDIVGATLGADYTFASDIRLGFAFSLGEGNSTSTGATSGENDFTYYGLSLYGAKHFDDFGLSFDMGYTVSENETVQKVAGSNLYGDVDAAMYTVGVKAEYVVPLDSFNMTPYAGVRFNYYDVDAYDTKGSTGTFLYENESSDSTVWEFPIGVTFDTTTQVGSWDFTPSLALGVKFAAGDLDAEQAVNFGKNTESIVFASEVVDNVTFQGGLGLAFTKDVCNLSLNYTLDYSENVESHGVSLNLRYDF